MYFHYTPDKCSINVVQLWCVCLCVRQAATSAEGFPWGRYCGSSDQSKNSEKARGPGLNGTTCSTAHTHPCTRRPHHRSAEHSLCQMKESDWPCFWPCVILYVLWESSWKWKTSGMFSFNAVVLCEHMSGILFYALQFSNSFLPQVPRCVIAGHIWPNGAAYDTILKVAGAIFCAYRVWEWGHLIVYRCHVYENGKHLENE